MYEIKKMQMFRNRESSDGSFGKIDAAVDTKVSCLQMHYQRKTWEIFGLNCVVKGSARQVARNALVKRDCVEPRLLSLA